MEPSREEPSLHREPEPGFSRLDRTSTDGEPFYCTFCGSGWNEYGACEDVRCTLETKDEAMKRHRLGKKPGYEYDPWPEGEQGDVVYAQFHHHYDALIFDQGEWRVTGTFRGTVPDETRSLTKVQYALHVTFRWL